MERRKLGQSDLLVSRVALGTMTFGAQVDEATALAMVDRYLERGHNFIDTANVYNAGAAEQIVGKALKGRRDRVVLASKVGIRMGDGADERGLSPRAIRHGAEASLRRLGTDHLDLFYLHQPDPETPLEDSLGALEELVREGKVRVVGASNYASWQVCRMLWLAERSGWRPVDVVQPMYNLIARGVEDEFLPMCARFGLATVAYNPLAGGLLTGKHRPEGPPPGTRFDRMPAYRDRYWHAANFEAVDELAAASAAAGRSLVSVALGWLLHHTPTDCVVVGASSPGQLEENLAAAEEGPLEAETLPACQRVGAVLRGPTPRYYR